MEITTENIRALSWKEPFAQLMLHGKIETRTWSTNYRGWVLICASQQRYNRDQVKRILDYDVNLIHRIDAFLSGKEYHNEGRAIAIGYLHDCRKMEVSDEQWAFVKYFPDLWCHFYKEVRAIEPFPFKGAQRWKKLDPETLMKIKLLKQ